MNMQQGRWLTGIGSAIVVIAVWAPSFQLGCAALATRVALFTLADGLICGAALAAVTRTRKPAWIYFWLLISALTFWPLYASWPEASPYDIPPSPGTPPWALGYFDMLRPITYLAGAPFPFVALGYHAADPVPAIVSDREEQEQVEET
jgi:hypothetical protein